MATWFHPLSLCISFSVVEKYGIRILSLPLRWSRLSVHRMRQLCDENQQTLRLWKLVDAFLKIISNQEPENCPDRVSMKLVSRRVTSL
jgi:hypothetical protein